MERALWNSDRVASKSLIMIEGLLCSATNIDFLSLHSHVIWSQTIVTDLFKILTLNNCCNLTNLPQFSGVVSLTFMAKHIEVPEVVNNKSGIDLWYDKDKSPQLPIVKMIGKKTFCTKNNTQTGY